MYNILEQNYEKNYILLSSDTDDYIRFYSYPLFKYSWNKFSNTVDFNSYSYYNIIANSWIRFSEEVIEDE